MVYITMDMIVDEGRVFGARYYTVQPTVWPNPNVPWIEMEQWMTETFGPSPVDGVFSPNGRWYANNERFWFRNKKDMEWFLLRWQ